MPELPLSLPPSLIPHPPQLDPSQRSCTVRVEQGEHLVRIGITFPSHYPHGAAPSFIFDKSTTVDILNQQELNRVGVSLLNLLLDHQASWEREILVIIII